MKILKAHISCGLKEEEAKLVSVSRGLNEYGCTPLVGKKQGEAALGCCRLDLAWKAVIHSYTAQSPAQGQLLFSHLQLLSGVRCHKIFQNVHLQTRLIIFQLVPLKIRWCTLSSFAHYNYLRLFLAICSLLNMDVTMWKRLLIQMNLPINTRLYGSPGFAELYTELQLIQLFKPTTFLFSHLL